MIRHTGGRSSLPGPTSTRSNSASRAMARAWGSGLIPSFAPSSPISSTSRARMRSLIRASSTAAMLASPLRFGTRRAAPAADSHQEAPPRGHRLHRPVGGRSSTESKDDPGADRPRTRDAGRVGTTKSLRSHFPIGLPWHHTRHMSSLWTPYGEQPVEPDRPDQPGAPGAGAPGGPGGAAPPPGYGGGGGEDAEPDPEEMREMLARLAATPVELI